MAAPGEPGSLGRTSEIATETDAPEVTTVSTQAASNTYGLGDSIRIDVTFDEDVAVTGEPRILLETGDTDRYATYDTTVSTAATVVAFTYEVAEGDVSTDLDYNTAATIDLNSGTIRDVAGNNANTTLPAPGNDGLSGNTLVIDGVRPTVDSVSSPDDGGTYGIGSVINVTVTFDDTVTVDTTGGTPALLLETGETDSSARYVSGSGGQDLLFQYTVTEDDVSTDLDYNGASALSLNSGSITDGAGNRANAASLSLSSLSGADTLAGSEALVVDGVRPTVDSVSSPDDGGTYGIGSVINVTVTFDDTVTVDTTGGTPTLLLETGETDRTADYVSGSGADLLFQYTVTEDDVSTDLDYNGRVGPVPQQRLDHGRRRQPRQRGLAVPVVPVRRGHARRLGGPGRRRRPPDRRTPSPRPTTAARTGSASVINVTVTFDDTVTVDTTGGTPALLLETGETDRTADYVSGSPGQSLLFQYTVMENDTSTDLDYNGAPSGPVPQRRLDHGRRRQRGHPGLAVPVGPDQRGHARRLGGPGRRRRPPDRRLRLLARRRRHVRDRLRDQRHRQVRQRCDGRHDGRDALH